MAEKIKTEKNKPKHVMQYPTDMDYIAVVGARTRTWDPSITGLRVLSGKGNQYMFINQGILQLRLFPEATQDYKIQRILVVFQHGYTATDIQRINNYVKILKARIIYIKTTNELVDFLNSRIDKKRLVKQLIFFSHGLIGKISFRYEGDDVASGEFTQQTVDKVNKLIFHYDAEVISYACRTGIGVDKESFKSSTEAQPANSLAQYMANAWMVKVKAFERRSLYAKTYGTTTEVAEAQNAQQQIKNYEGQLKSYNDGGLKEQPQAPKNYDQLKSRAKSITQREDNSKNDNGPIMERGAWHLPTAGKTPTGLKDGLQTYTYKKK